MSTRDPDASGASSTLSSLPGADGAGSAFTLYARETAGFPDRVAEAVATLRDAVTDGPVVQASSLGAEDMVITHLINTHRLPIGLFVLETGTLPPETLTLLDTLRAQQAGQPLAPLAVYTPVQEAVVQFVAREGQDAMYRSIELRKACCGIRKLEPLERALAGHRAWITGLRREQSGARAQVPLRDDSDLATKGRLKFNPLASWSWADVWHYIQQNNVPYNPLHDRFMPSIGCAPCTRAIAVGEDFRAGRWWWEDEAAKECGLHVPSTDTKVQVPA
jgi:phosphoadenosine phosphosulfate reductase